MANLITFANAFLSYLFLFLFVVILVIAACLIGIRLRKNKDAKDALPKETNTVSPVK